MKWVKKGHIFKPNGTLEWSVSHAQIPRALILKDRIRIFYATRYFDDKGLPLSQTSFIDVDKFDLTKIIKVEEKVSLELGDRGSFSEFGIHPTMLVRNGEEVVFFYQGWQRSDPFPYKTEIGIATSLNDGNSFISEGEGPVLGISPEDPHFVNGVFIHQEKGINHMWYSSGTEWIQDNGRYESVYKIKYASSTNFDNWNLNKSFCIPENEENECQNSATVIKINDTYHMWFCYRPGLNFRNANRGYRIGYASSKDLLNWERDDSKCGIDVSSDLNSWDSEMICYPYVFRLEDRIIMLYCGNYFGKTGFGYAELDINF